MQEAWADHFNPTFVTVVDGVIIALVWECGGSRHFAFFFRLDAHAEARRTICGKMITDLRGADLIVFRTN